MFSRVIAKNVGDVFFFETQCRSLYLIVLIFAFWNSCYTNQIHNEYGFKMCQCDYNANDSSCREKHAIVMSTIVHQSACIFFICLDMWRELWCKHVHVKFLWILQIKKDLTQIKVGNSQMASDDNRTTYAGMSQIYTHTYVHSPLRQKREIKQRTEHTDRDRQIP